MQLAFLHRDETGTPDSPIIILIHGVFGRARNMGPMQRALSPFFNTYALDMRAHGNSPHAPLSYPAMAQDILDTLDHLGLENVGLVGHSMGGKIAMATSLLAPERINRLFVADMAPALMRHGQSALARKLQTLHLPRLRSHKEAKNFLLPFTRDHGVAELIGQHISPGEDTHWTIGLDDIANSFTEIEGWPTKEFEGRSWNGPTLFLRGGNSPYVMPEHEDIIHHYFPKAVIETLPGAGHWLHIDKPGPFNTIMLRFMKEGL